MTALEAVPDPDPEPEKPTLDLAGINLSFTPTLGEMVFAEKAATAWERSVDSKAPPVTSDQFVGGYGTAVAIWVALRRAGRPMPFAELAELPTDVVQAALDSRGDAEGEKDDADQRPG